MRFFEQQDEARAQSLRLLFLFSLAVLATVLGVHLGLAACWMALRLISPIPLDFPRLFFAVNVGVTLLLVLGGWWIETTNLQAEGGAERLARQLGARELRPGSSQQEQQLANVVDEVCIAAHMRHPQVMLLPRHQGINAFAAGCQPQDGIVCVTQGALDLLTRDELQGMVAHECSHLHEGDTHLNMELAGMVLGLELVWGFGEDIRERGGIAAVVGTVIMVMGSVGWSAGRVLQASVSRQREYLADARAVQWTRNADGLGGVLRKALTQREDPQEQPDDPSWPTRTEHLLLVGNVAERRGWFDTHPPLAERIRRIYGRPMPALPLPHDARATAITWA